MENAADALKMAGAVMLFVLALSIIIFAFGQARESADIILDYRDRETSYVDTDYYVGTGITERTVSFETMIPSIFRAYLENYKIVFDGLSSPIYKIVNKNGNTIERKSLDLETNFNTEYNNVVLATDELKAEFICGVLYHDFKTNKDDFAEKFNIILDNECVSIYDQLRDKTITEYLGVYYQKDDPNVPDIMKDEKRIITYRVN